MLLNLGVIDDQREAGRYALIGAAACLGGVTRMTVTIAVILSEISDDIRMLPVCMLSLAVARVVGNAISESFDHGMIELAAVPFLAETPPRVFEVLTAKDVMAPRPVRLLEVTTVGDVMLALTNCSHNGFPVVSGSSISEPINRVPGSGSRSASHNICGLILRRQLLVLLREKVWESQMHGLPLDDSAKQRFLSSFYVMAQLDLDVETARVQGTLSPTDFEAPLDLRSFYDPSPFAVNSLAPLSVVYRLFNEIGVRHIPVLSSSLNLVGIITRKDVQPDTISLRLSAVEVHAWANDMHRYWRSLLYGNEGESAAQQGSAESRRTSTSQPRRVSTNGSDSSVSSGRQTMKSSVLSSIESTSRRLSTPMLSLMSSRRASINTGRISAPSRRGSTERSVTARRGSIDARRGSVVPSLNGLPKALVEPPPLDSKMLARASSPSSNAGSVYSEDRGSVDSVSFSTRTAGGGAQSRDNNRVPTGVNILRKSGNLILRKSGGLLRNQHSQRDLLANSLLLVPDALSGGSESPKSPLSATDNKDLTPTVWPPDLHGVLHGIPKNGGTSEQPSLQASLLAASVHRQSRLGDGLSSYNKVQYSRLMWQLQNKRPVIQRRTSAPAKLLRDQFSSLTAVAEM